MPKKNEYCEACDKLRPVRFYEGLRLCHECEQELRQMDGDDRHNQAKYDYACGYYD